MTEAKIIADSSNFIGDRAISYLTKVPQIIVKELLRHRMFSFSSSSVRAIPYGKMLDNLRKDHFKPTAFQKNHSGMQGTEYIDSKAPYYVWENAMGEMIEKARQLHETEATKQISGRLLEPFGYANILITATEYGNFFSLRCPQYYNDLEDRYFNSKEDWLKHYRANYDNTAFDMPEEDWRDINASQAEIHIQELAEMMWDAKTTSDSKEITHKEWHIPDFGLDQKLLKEFLSKGRLTESYVKRRISAAHCAKLSYNNHGVGVDFSKDIKLHESLISSQHWSAFEHTLRPLTKQEYFAYSKTYITDNLSDRVLEEVEQKKTKVESFKRNKYLVTEYGWCRNLRGFTSYRNEIDIS